MKENIKEFIIENIKNFRLPRYDELPNMGLYLEQTTKYLNVFFEPLQYIEVTPSMISNYVKKDLIPNPKKKQYYAEHIAYLVFVSFAKNAVTIDDLRLWIKMQQDSYTLPIAYDYFCNEFENMLLYHFRIKEDVDILGVTESIEKDMLKSMAFCAASSIHMSACFDIIRQQREK